MLTVFFFSIENENDLLLPEQRHLAYCEHEKACPLLFVALVDKLLPVKDLDVFFITVQSTIWIKSRFIFIR